MPNLININVSDEKTKKSNLQTLLCVRWANNIHLICHQFDMLTHCDMLLLVSCRWFKLLNKAGKADKERGEVLLDIQFLKSSMSVSMIDLSDKSHSRLGKFKDKLRGKKKDGLSDSASAILPSVSQVLTDSEGEMDGVTEGEATKKKKNKLKSLFAPKSNMKRNSMSQSMSSLGTLPDKNSSISSSTSSGLNVESSEGTKYLILLFVI